MTHHDTDLSCDQRLGHPHLWACAISRVAEVEGLNGEALSACIDSNFGFLEHTGTALATKKTGGHEIGTDAPCLIAAPPSTRKSRLIQYTDSLCTDSRFAPDELKNRHFHMGDATTKGIRTQLLLFCINCCVFFHTDIHTVCCYTVTRCFRQRMRLNFSRCILSSDECANVLESPYADKTGSVHFVSNHCHLSALRLFHVSFLTSWSNISCCLPRCYADSAF